MTTIDVCRSEKQFINVATITNVVVIIIVIIISVVIISVVIISVVIAIVAIITFVVFTVITVFINLTLGHIIGYIVIVNSRFLQRSQKRSCGNQLIHRRLKDKRPFRRKGR